MTPELRRVSIMFGRMVANLLCVVTLLVAGWYPDSVMAQTMRYAAFAYIIGDLLVRARSGYLRRRPYWTSASSRRFLIACAFPIAALVFTFWVTLASDANPALLGPRGSSTRDLWAAGLVLGLLFGACGVASAVAWLEYGDPTKEFRWPNLSVRPKS